MSKLRLMTIVGTRPEIIRLSQVIKKCDKYFPNLDEMDEWTIEESSDERTYFDLEYEFVKYVKK